MLFVIGMYVYSVCLQRMTKRINMRLRNYVTDRVQGVRIMGLHLA